MMTNQLGALRVAQVSTSQEHVFASSRLGRRSARNKPKRRSRYRLKLASALTTVPFARLTPPRYRYTRLH